MTNVWRASFTLGRTRHIGHAPVPLAQSSVVDQDVDIAEPLDHLVHNGRDSSLRTSRQRTAPSVPRSAAHLRILGRVSTGNRRAELDDPAGLLQGTGGRMQHVKMNPGLRMNYAALSALIRAAYTHIKSRQIAE